MSASPAEPYWQDPDYQDWLNELMENAGDEWDGDEAMEAIALRYVRHLEDTLNKVKVAFNQHRALAVTGDKAGAVARWDELVRLIGGTFGGEGEGQ